MTKFECWNLLLLGLQTLIIGVGGILAWIESKKWREIRKSDEIRKFKKLFGRLQVTHVDLFHKAAKAFQGKLQSGLEENFIQEQDEILYEFDKFIREYSVIYPKLGYFLLEKITDKVREIRPEIDRVSKAILSNNKEYAERILKTNFNEQYKFVDKVLEKQKDKLNDYFAEEIN